MLRAFLRLLQVNAGMATDDSLHRQLTYRIYSLHVSLHKPSDKQWRIYVAKYVIFFKTIPALQGNQKSWKLWVCGETFIFI